MNGFKYDKNYFKYILGIIYPVLIFIGATFLVTMLFEFVSIIFFKVELNNLVEFSNSKIMLVNIFVQLLCIAITLPIYLHDKKNYYPEYKNKVSIKMIILGAISILGISVIGDYILELIQKFYTPSDGGIEYVNSLITSGSVLEMVISTVILAPICEELIFRGLILNRVWSKRNAFIAVLVSSLLFGFIHFNVIQGINACLMGLFLGYLYVKTKSIYPCMLAHLLNNLMAVISLYIPEYGLYILQVVFVLGCIYPLIKFIKAKEIK